MEKNVEYYSKMDYNIPDDLIPYIASDERKAKYLKYSQLEEFYQLPIEEMNRITRGISSIAEQKYLNGEYKGFYTDYDGSVYYFKVSNEDTFGITKIKKYNEKMEDIADGRTLEKNISNSLANTNNEQNGLFRNFSAIKDRGALQEDVRLPINNRLRNNKNQSNNRQSIRNQKELDNSSFSLKQNEINLNDVNSEKYSQNNQTWQEHLNKNYKPTGTRTDMNEIK